LGEPARMHAARVSIPVSGDGLCVLCAHVVVSRH
jgi:hypothetical protein